MQWFKMQSSLRHNPVYRRLSPLAKVAFCGALMTVADLEFGELLTTRDGPLSDEEMAYNLCVPEKQLRSVLEELRTKGFLALENGAWRVAKFKDKNASNAERQRRWRERHRNVTDERNDNVTHNDRNSNDACNAREITGEIEKEKESTNVLPDKPDRVPRNGRGEPSAEDLATWSILAEAVKVVWEHCRPAYSQSEWRKRNKAAAAMLVEQGHDAGEVAEVLSAMYTHPKASDTYGRSTKLMVLVENWQRLTELADGHDGSQRDRALRGEYLPVV